MLKLNVNTYEFDSRLTEWNLRHNKLTKSDLDQYLKNLSDESANAMNLNIEESDLNSNGHATQV